MKATTKPKFIISFRDDGFVWNAIPVNMEAVKWWNNNRCINRMRYLNGTYVPEPELMVRIKDKR
jgi:hypothetical protein